MKKFLSIVIIALFSFIGLLPFNAKADSTSLKENQQMINQLTSQVDLKTNSDKIVTSKSDAIYQDSNNNIANGTTKIHSKFKGVAAGEGATIGEIKWRISNEYVNGKSQFTYHIDNLIGVRPILMEVVLQVAVRNGVTDAPQPYGTATLTFNTAEITPGASKSMSVNARTGYLTVYGAYGALAPDGNPNYYTIGASTILTNKLNQYFPNYVDPVSGKQAVTAIRTDWALTGSHPWNGRAAYKKQFETQYGVQPQSYWDSVQIHHIRPRNFGGDDSYDNLMPVVTRPSHLLISKWFTNYK
ncbi:HNH endonuclease signature motif containing protein [Clostridium sp. HBUAS56017]|uniref:HNH endonuclease signature motif containing protein n=1 Tax=Clostridium sp. HBUAS56017 TaxID=2571128 RepID=UPI001177926B|nr:HNH endonuclease signature motif containing protein [Clostridium sp. HBUAS56017]